MAYQQKFSTIVCRLVSFACRSHVAEQTPAFHDAKHQARPGLCSQSRPQSASAHKRKGWHALQQGTAPQPGHTGRQSNSSAVYVRPDRTVNTDISLDNSPSFPSLANFADALPTSQTTQPANVAHASKQNPWASPSGKQNSQQTNSPGSGAAASKPAQRYSAALSPAKPSQEEPQSKLSSGMAMSNSELTNITSLLSTHPWAEPGLAQVSLPHMHSHCSPNTVDSPFQSSNCDPPHARTHQPISMPTFTQLNMLLFFNQQLVYYWALI